jgi:hypothetical protein
VAAAAITTVGVRIDATSSQRHSKTRTKGPARSNGAVGARARAPLHRKPNTSVPTEASRWRSTVPQVDSPARAAARAMHVEPRHVGDQRGSDRWRPKHVPTEGELIVPSLDDASISARAALSAVSRLAPYVETPRPNAHDSLGPVRNVVGN